MTSQRQALLGMFFVLVFGILGWFTLFESDLSWFREKFSVKVHFEEAGGLREGDPVLVAGMRWGEVESLTYDPERTPDERVEVVLVLNEPVRLFGDHAIRIEDATVLGGKQLTIDPGEPAQGEVPSEGLYGQVSPGVMKALAEVVDENRESFRNILTGLETLVGDVQGGEGILSRLLYDEELANNLGNAVEAVSATFENAEALTAGLREGTGTFGRLFQDEALYTQITGIADGVQGFVERAERLLADVEAGKGTVGMLLRDEEASQDVRESLASLKTILADLEKGQGTLGKLLKDPSVAENLDRITTAIADGEGTLGRLLMEDDVYEDIAAIAENLADVSRALREGEGTLGKLLYDDELYAEARKALGVLTGTLEEAREAAPISTFLSTLFLGF